MIRNYDKSCFILTSSEITDNNIIAVKERIQFKAIITDF